MMPILSNLRKQKIIDLIARENALLLQAYREHHDATGHTEVVLLNNAVECYQCSFHCHAAGSEPARVVENNGNVVLQEVS